MIKRTRFISLGFGVMSALACQFVGAATLAEDVQSLYDSKLKDLFIHFHENPELSFKEDKTAARLGMSWRRWVTPFIVGLVELA